MKNSLCLYDEDFFVSFFALMTGKSSFFVVGMTGKTGSNIPVGPEPASALIRRSTTLLTWGARYSDIQYNIFDFHFVWYLLGDSDAQIFNYSIPYIYYRGLSLSGNFAELHTRVFLQRLFIFTNIIFADASHSCERLWKIRIWLQNKWCMKKCHSEKLCSFYLTLGGVGLVNWWISIYNPLSE